MAERDDSQESLEEHLIWLYGSTTHCKCTHDRVSIGIVDGINMGKCWGRVTTHPNCPEHGTEAEKARAERLRRSR